MPTTPDRNTKREEEREARAEHTADREPSDDEARAAEENPPVSPDAAKAYEDAMERGVNSKGEGRIEP
jgi:hypothetical protein